MEFDAFDQNYPFDETAEGIYNKIFDEYETRDLHVDRNNKGTDIAICAMTYSKMLESVYINLRASAKNIWPHYSALEALKKHLKTFQLEYQYAAKAAMVIEFGRTVADPGKDHLIETGTKVYIEQNNEVLIFVTDQDVTLQATTLTVTVAATAEAGGTKYNNIAIDTPFSFYGAPPGGIEYAKAYTTSGAGTDDETEEEALTRLDNKLQNPDNGGTAADYQKWAKEHPQVESSTVVANQNGLIEIYIQVTGGGTASQTIIDETLAIIDTKRPVDDQAVVYSATAILFAFDVTLILDSGYILSNVSQSVKDAIKVKLLSMAQNDMVYLTQIGDAIDDVDGVKSYVFNLKNTNGEADSNNQGDAVLSAVTANAGAVSEKWTVKFTSPTNFIVTSEVSGAQGSGTTATDFTSTNGYITIPSASWSGTPVVNDLFSSWTTMTGNRQLSASELAESKDSILILGI